MFGYVLQDWTTIRAQSNTVTVVQNESDWMGFSSFQDMVFWIDTREATLPASSNIALSIQTSPTKDEVLFQTMVTANFAPASYAAGLVTPLPKVILAQGPSVPLATWVRWSLALTAGTGAWDLTFRILVSANRVWK